MNNTMRKKRTSKFIEKQSEWVRRLSVRGEKVGKIKEQRDKLRPGASSKINSGSFKVSPRNMFVRNQASAQFCLWAAIKKLCKLKRLMNRELRTHLLMESHLVIDLITRRL